LVKLAPDLNDEELDDDLEVILRQGIDGVIATNTHANARGEGLTSPQAGESGGLSGAPLSLLSREMVRKISMRTAGQLPIIGIGGVMNPQDARAMLDAGAVLVQVYTGLVYAGPGLVKRILEG
jgi:dihydroorotate dehydrogenase